MLRRLLLKNWNDSATCDGVHVVDVTQIGGVRDAVAGAGEELRRQQALKARGERLERDAHDDGVPACGPGVWSNIAVARKRIGDGGPLGQLVAPARGDADALETRQEGLELRPDRLALVWLRRAHAHEHTLDLTRAIVNRPAERHRRVAIGVEVWHQAGQRRPRPGTRQVGAVLVDCHGQARARHSARGVRCTCRCGCPGLPARKAANARSSMQETRV